jgi:hypothetical protein
MWNQTRARVVLLAMIAIGAFSLQLSNAGLIDHDGKPCNIVNGLCHSQFPDEQ